MNSGWEFNHSGVFARDFDRTLEYYKSLGLAPDLPRTGPELTGIVAII